MQPLAIMFFLILVELAVGGFLVVAVADYEGIATKGFLGLAAATYLAVGLVGWWARGQIAPAVAGAGLPVDTAWQGLEGAGLLVFTVGLALYALLLFGPNPGPRRLVGVVTVAGGLVSLFASGLVYRVPHLGGLSTVLSVLIGAVVIGSAMSGMILGHWYLVTPGLSPRPLRTMTVVLFAALVVQALLIPVWLLFIGEPAGRPDAAALVTGIYSVPFWLRVLVGIALPLAVAAMTWQCCRIRSLQSATGLLYVAVALVLAGEIVSKLLLVLAGVPV
jgi:DMSO reductase anchor subunit